MLSDALWSVYLRGAGPIDKNKQAQNPDRKLFSPASWDLVCYLDITFDRFRGLQKHITSKLKVWQEWAAAPTAASDPLSNRLPDDWDNLSLFEKMIVLKIFRPDKTVFAVAKYVHANLQQFYLDPPPATMDKIHADSDAKTPIIFVLSQGADPTAQVLTFAQSMGMTERLKTISLG
jgi:dynein heavy chain